MTKAQALTEKKTHTQLSMICSKKGLIFVLSKLFFSAPTHTHTKK